MERLDEIVAIMDIEKMSAQLEKEGFRRAGQEGIWEWEYLWIKEHCIEEGRVSCEDVFADREYRVKVYTGEGGIFIILSVLRIERAFDNLPVPWKSFLYTNLPMREEYEREQRVVVRCDGCKKELEKGETTAFYGRRYCGKCLLKNIKKER